jgi:hypothetical protein
MNACERDAPGRPAHRRNQRVDWHARGAQFDVKYPGHLLPHDADADKAAKRFCKSVRLGQILQNILILIMFRVLPNVRTRR